MMEKCPNNSRHSQSHKPFATACFVLLSLTSGFAQAGNHVPVATANFKTETRTVAPEQQKWNIKGIVTDSQGESIVGANVLIKGTQKGAITDLNGNFEINVDQNQPVTIVVSFIGFASQELKATPDRATKVTLKDDSKALEEVVVTGYGTFKKSAYAGSASTVKTDNIKDIPAISFQDLLQGNATGVQFSSPSGQPGAAASLTIRGMGSFNASNSPLYVIDGVPVNSGSINSLTSDSGLDVMSTINNSDIENITIIKDAAAASLYGSRAANGVVLITTKKGKAGAPVVTLKADWGFSDFAMDFRPIMNGEQRREYIYNGLRIGQERKGKSETAAIAYADKNIDKYAPVPWCGYTNWDDYMFKKGSHQNYEASLSGGTDKFKFYSSLAYLKQEGIVKTSGLERISGRLNVDYQASNKLKVGANIMFTTLNQDVYSEGTGYTTPFYSTRSKLTPSDPVFNEDGTYNQDLISLARRNPILANEYNFQREYVNRMFNTLYAEYEFIKDLKLKSTLSYDYNVSKGKQWYDSRTSDGEKNNGGMEKAYSEYQKLVWANQISYKKTIAQNHFVDVLAGYEIDSKYTDGLSGYATNFMTPTKNDIANGQTLEALGGSSKATRLVSYLTRLNYDYKHKYYAGVSYRTDGSSRLHRDNRWGNFWSVSGAWRIIEEDFMKPTQGWLSDLKLRASYGVNGTLPSDYYGYMGLSSLNDGGYMESPGLIQSQIENRDLKWETNYNMNIGLDLAFWERLNVTVEYYTRTTKNLLMDCPVSMTTGFSTYLMNIGEVKNKGVEVEINSKNILTKDFQWNTTLNLSHNQNRIVKLDGEQTMIKSGTQIRQIGSSYRTFYLIEFAGINPMTGVPQFYTNTVDANGNLEKNITETSSKANAIALNKQAEPKLTGGFTNSFHYKWIDLNFMFSYQFGAYGYDNWAQKTEHGGKDLTLSIPAYYLDNWKQPGDISNYEVFMESPATAMSGVATTRRLHSTDFIRLKTLTLGVTVPKAWSQKIGVNNLRLYASANNLWTWAAYDNYDPESVTAGTAGWGTPPLKAVTFGLNLNF